MTKTLHDFTNKLMSNIRQYQAVPQTPRDNIETLVFTLKIGLQAFDHEGLQNHMVLKNDVPTQSVKCRHVLLCLREPVLTV